MKVFSTALFLIAGSAFGWSTLNADDFTRFRGTDATGVAKDHPDLPDQWNKTDQVAWTVDVPGQGWGSPIVVGDQIILHEFLPPGPFVRSDHANQRSAGDGLPNGKRHRIIAPP